MNKDNIIANKFGNRLRIRACGLLIKEKKILLIKHEGLGKLNALWAPPGGAVEFGETIMWKPSKTVEIDKDEERS